MASRELMDEAPLEGPVTRELNSLEGVGYSSVGTSRSGMDAQHLRNLVVDSKRWVEGGCGILCQIGDYAPAQPPKLPFRKTNHFSSLNLD